MKSEESEGDPLTTDSFFVSCKLAGLTFQDLDEMTIGMCLDFIDEYIQFTTPKKKKKKAKKATQKDFDAF